MIENSLAEFAKRGVEILEQEDKYLYDLLYQEHCRQANVLTMVAASSIADPSVLACEGMSATNVTTEGYPGARFHAGCSVIDEIERLAIERAKFAFGAKYANVQPHSGTTANEIVMLSLLKPGDTILGLELNSGGHLTHGSKASISGQYFNAIGYSLNEEGFIDYNQINDLAQKFKPKLIICGASAYPRFIDFKRFREIADNVHAFLMADISHIAGLVVAGEHPSPIDEAHFTTTSTYKQLYGPRGGLIMMGKDYQTVIGESRRSLSQIMQKAVFPFLQGTPNINAIAAKARALEVISRARFKELMKDVKKNASILAKCFKDKGYKVLTDGTDNHLVLIDMLSKGATGYIAEKALEECNIVVNKNRIPNDVKSASITSGIRLGTNSLALRGMRENEMRTCVELVENVITAIEVVNDNTYNLDSDAKSFVRQHVQHLCLQFPIPRYHTDSF